MLLSSDSSGGWRGLLLESRTFSKAVYRHPAMLMHRRKPLTIALLLLLITASSGCVDGPLRLGKYMSWNKKEWKMDEEYGPTIHDKLEELDNIRAAARKLSPQEQQEKSQELLGFLRNEKNLILIAALTKTLAVFPTPESAEGLRLASTHGDSTIRITACQGWGQKGGSESVEALANILGSDTDLDVRIAAAHALEKFRDPIAIRALGTALDANDPALQFRAVQSLKKVTGRDYGDSVPAWREFVESGQAKPAADSSIAERFRKLF